MEKMKFNELSEANQAEIRKKLDEKIENVDYSQVVILPESTKDNLVVKYKDWTINLPIQGPDKPTTNTIWTILATGAVVIGAVATTLLFSKDK